MSAVLSSRTLRATLDALECHFTWNLDNNRLNVLCLMSALEDIGTEEGNPWLGHVYNLQAHAHFLLASEEDAPGSTVEDALRCFGTAAEAFRQIRNTVSDEGPWLLVNYGNLAWLHYHMGEQAKSLEYAGKTEALLREHPPPTQGQLHPEVLAEKAWTLMNFSPDRQREAVELFGKAIEVEPAVVEWTTSHALALALASSSEDLSPGQEANILETLRRASEGDPDNLYLAAVHLERLAKTGAAIEDQARDLAKRVLRKAQSSYSGIRPLLWLYRQHVSLDEAIDVAEAALERHPTKRHLKRCLASCYKWKTFSDGNATLIESLRKRAIGLYEELMTLYPHTLFMEKLTLAVLYSQSTNPDYTLSDNIFKELLETELEPPELQTLYNRYAKYLNFSRQSRHESIKYHMKAAEIPHHSGFRTSSIQILTQIKNRRMNQMCGEIEDFLAQLDY